MNKILKGVILCGMLSSLTGCLYQSVNSVDIYYAEEYCKDLRGSNLRNIQEYWTGDSSVRCENGDYLRNLSNYKDLELRQRVYEDKL